MRSASHLELLITDMKTYSLFLCAIALAVATSACSHTTEGCGRAENFDAMKSLDLANAEADARRAYALKDYRLLAINGFTLEVPGTSDTDAARSRYGVKIIEGTSDALCSTEQGNLIKKSRAYAEKYNQTMISIMH
jgi:hypothetical protein